jgi:hypothetical protein
MCRNMRCENRITGLILYDWQEKRRVLGSGTTYDWAALCQAATNTCFVIATGTGVCLLICPKHGRKVIRTDLSKILLEIADFL